MLAINVTQNLKPYLTVIVKIAAVPQVQYLAQTFSFQKAKLKLVVKSHLTLIFLTAAAP